jgi:hypothetical protein
MTEIPNIYFSFGHWKFEFGFIRDLDIVIWDFREQIFKRPDRND